ncbi:MAG: amino acid deaminase/aldolase [Pseudonocardiaceae bacterium]|nr:amino acid deaminase/aldolase [Pseudonocardiaceae bacterium]
MIGTPPHLDQDRERYEAATADLDAPLAIVDLDVFDENTEVMTARAGGLPIRVAAKSVRCRYLLRRVLGRPGFAGLMCYSLREALWLHAEGIAGDLLVGYPCVDHVALRELARDDRARAAITLMVDSPEHLDVVHAALGAAHPEIRVCLEFDTSWRPLPGVHVGTRRSPVRTPRQAEAMAREVMARNGFRLVGLMGYEGHIAGVGDAPSNPARAAVLRWMQARSARELAERRASIVDAVRAVAPLEFVNGGGTGSIETTGTEHAVTEIGAGSGLIGPTLFDHYSRFRPRPAVLFALPVVRRPTRRIATLFAGGYLASGAAGADRLPTPYLPGGLRLLRVEGAGEVQTPVVGAAARGLRLGDRVWLRHAKAGELAERFDGYHVVRGNQVIDRVPTYRGDGQCFG